MSDEGDRTDHDGLAGGYHSAAGSRRRCVLTINGGSPSLKFAVVAAADPREWVLSDRVERVGLGGSRLVIIDASDGRWDDIAVEVADLAGASDECPARLQALKKPWIASCFPAGFGSFIRACCRPKAQGNELVGRSRLTPLRRGEEAQERLVGRGAGLQGVVRALAAHERAGSPRSVP
jgi:hypothetical protein